MVPKILCNIVLQSSLLLIMSVGCNSVKEIDPKAADPAPPATTLNGKKLVWHDEFNDQKGTMPNSDKWVFEKGFVRNQELQWYSDQNASCDGEGNMVIVGRHEVSKNPIYTGQGDWRTTRRTIDYTSSSIMTSGKFEFKYGTLIVRAKIPTQMGAWPAIWTLGNRYTWPSCGEVDLMEYYLKDSIPSILANMAWASDTPYQPVWNSKVIPLSYFTQKDPEWADKYHVWQMDWDENGISLYLDGELLNHHSMSKSINGKNTGSGGEGENAFMHPQYILLNLALGQNGGTPNNEEFPLYYYIDYVRVYQ